MHLKEWTRIFLKQRDLLKQEMVSMDEDNEGFSLETKAGKKKVIVEESLRVADADMIVCLNKEQNVKTLVREWQSFTKQQDLIIVFANPQKNEKWLVKPHHHDKISDDESLEQGLRSMSEAITVV